MAATGNSQVQEQALAVLRDLAFTPDNRQLISGSKGVHILSDIMASQPPLACRIHAASCLRSLALDLNQAAQVNQCLMPRMYPELPVALPCRCPSRLSEMESAFHSPKEFGQNGVHLLDISSLDR